MPACSCMAEPAVVCAQHACMHYHCHCVCVCACAPVQVDSVIRCIALRRLCQRAPLSDTSSYTRESAFSRYARGSHMQSSVRIAPLCSMHAAAVREHSLRADCVSSPRLKAACCVALRLAWCSTLCVLCRWASTLIRTGPSHLCGMSGCGASNVTSRT